jgi:hypothetical protein
VIHVGVPAYMRCEEEGCPARQPVDMLLLGSGAFAFKPSVEGWQVALPTGAAALGSPFRTRCPEHKQKIQIGPAGPRVVAAT